MKTSMRDITNMCEQIERIIEECIVDELVKWAEQDDAYLRNNDGFIDHTGNLRSSLGAAVFKDTEMVFSTPFDVVLGGTKGSSEGKRTVLMFAESTRGKIAKVMVAGMDYAQKVEDIDSKDVLESRRIQCEREAQAVYERAMRKADRQIKQLMR